MGVLLRGGVVALLAVAVAGCGAAQSSPVDTTAAEAVVPSVAPTADIAASVAARASEEAAADASAAAQAVEDERVAEEARVEAERVEAERAEEERQRQEAEAAAAAAAVVVMAEEEAAAQVAAEQVAALWTVTNIVDGDTIDVERGGTTERVRVLGIDTPERGECGFEEASSAMGSLVGGQSVVLGVQGRDERDRYDRLIAYVDTTDGVDAGLTLIGDGLAIARYDSRDGYGSHPREQAYVAEDDASDVGYSCTAPAPSPVEEPAPAPPAPAPAAPEPAAEPEPAAGYQDGPYQNCGAVRAAGAAPITADNPWFESKFDRDGDGVGCES